MKKILVFSILIFTLTLIYSKELTLDQIKERFEKDDYKLQVYNDVMNELNGIETDYNRAKVYEIRNKLKNLLYFSLNSTKQEFLKKYNAQQNGTQTDNAFNKELPDELKGLKDQALIQKIHDLYAKHKNYGYSKARYLMYNKIDNENGKLRCVYTGNYYPVDGNDYNCEHTWPQSFFRKADPMRSDIHHLFPTLMKANSMRGSFYFGEVTGKVKWQMGGSKLGYNKRGRLVFEPRDDHKGDVARAMFYMATIYCDKEMNAGGGNINPGENKIHDDVEAVLKKWNKQDPPSKWEIERNKKIEKYQHNINPFVVYPGLADKISNF